MILHICNAKVSSIRRILEHKFMIFSCVFEKAEPQLLVRWIELKNRLGLPNRVDHQTIREGAAFTDAELGALVLLGNSQLNPGLLLTDNEKNRQSQIKDAEKKRAALAKAKASPQPPSTPALAER